MKKSNNVIIIGCNIPALYAAIKYVDLGYNVTIIEKKASYLPIYAAAYHNFNLYNENHKAYVSLLRRFDIHPKIVKLKSNNARMFQLVNNVILNSKHLPTNMLLTHTFKSLCKLILTEKELDELNSYEHIFNGILNMLTALDCIHMFTYDIITDTYFYLDNQTINELIRKMIIYLQSKSAKFMYNIEIKNIKYLKKKFTLNNIYTCDILVTCISRDNLTKFIFWNTDQKLLLNSVSAINSSVIRNMFEKLINLPSDTHSHTQMLLNDLHIVYPIYTNKSKYTYIWNNGMNNILIREKIKNMYNLKFLICSESFSKNNIFVNYSLEYIDNTLTAT